MDQCPECGSSDLLEFDEYFECAECGSQYELDSENDDYTEY